VRWRELAQPTRRNAEMMMNDNFINAPSPTDDSKLNHAKRVTCANLQLLDKCAGVTGVSSGDLLGSIFNDS